MYLLIGKSDVKNVNMYFNICNSVEIFSTSSSKSEKKILLYRRSLIIWKKLESIKREF